MTKLSLPHLTSPTSAVLAVLLPQVRAGDWISDAFTRIFNPKRSDVPLIDTSPFAGSAKRPAGRKPFKDGFSAAAETDGKATKTAKASQSSSTPKDMPEQAQDGPLAYIGAAVRSLVGSNFTSEVDGKSTGSSGWKGNVRHQQHRRDDKG